MRRAASPSDRAFVLRSSPYGEADVVVHLLCEREGVLPALAKRARAARRSLVLEPFHTLRVELSRGTGELSIVRSAAIDVARSGLLEDAARLDAAGTATRWTRALSPQRTPEPEVFMALERALDALVENVDPSSMLAAFGLVLLDALGYALELRGCARCMRERPAGRAAYVVGAAGGVLCDACRRGVSIEAPLLPGALLDRVAEDPWLLLDAKQGEGSALLAVVREAVDARARSVGART